MKIPLLATWGNACTSISKQFAPSCSWIRTVIHHANSKGKYSQGNGRVKSQPPGNLMSVFMCRLLHHKYHTLIPLNNKGKPLTCGLVGKTEWKSSIHVRVKTYPALWWRIKRLCAMLFTSAGGGVQADSMKREQTMTGQFPCTWSFPSFCIIQSSQLTLKASKMPSY